MGYIWMLIICINYNYPWYVNVHVALIYTCNMKENALASCVHMHGHVAWSRVWVHGIVYSPMLVNGS